MNIKKVIYDACLVNDAVNLSSVIEVEFSNKLKTAFGKAYPNKNLIVVNMRLWNIASGEQQREMLTHESCHIITYQKAWATGYNPSDAHGKEWVSAMEKCGYSNPSTHHDLDMSIKPLGKMASLTCQCRTFVVTEQMRTTVLTDDWCCDICNDKFR